VFTFPHKTTTITASCQFVNCMVTTFVDDSKLISHHIPPNAAAAAACTSVVD